ncbi:MAG: PH domain-containing protein [Nanoarchaeota archaeon]
MGKKKEDLFKETETSDNFLITFRKTRKVFLLEYAAGFLLLSLLVASYLEDVFVRREIQYFVLGLALFAFVYVEGSRLFVRYEIQPKKVVIVHGLFKQAKKNVYFQPLGYLPDLNIKQNRMQRLLNYGTIYVKSSGEVTFEINDIDDPQKVMKLLEDLIEKSRMEKK